MRVPTLLIVALCWAVLALAARAEKRLIDVKQPVPPVLKPADTKAGAASTDPTEPPLQVEVTHSNIYTPGGARLGQKAQVESGARGTTVQVPTQGQWSGSAEVTFKNSAAPMRFTTRLTGMPNYDLSSLSLSSGGRTLQVGSVGTSSTTKYYDARGQEQASSVGAAYIVVARRGENGQVDIQLRRGAGATLGKTFTLTWQSNANETRFGMKRLGGG
jgi:hypothetical protein